APELPVPPPDPAAAIVAGPVTADRSAGPAPSRRFAAGSLLRTAVVVLMVFGLAVQVRGEGAFVQEEIMDQVTVAKEALAASRSAFAAGDLIAAEDQLGIAEHSLHQANRSVASLGQQGGISLGPAAGDRAVAAELLATGERSIRTVRALVKDVRTIPDRAAEAEGGFYATGQVVLDDVPEIRGHLEALDGELGLIAVLAERAKGSDRAELRDAGEQFVAMVPDADASLDRARDVAAALPDLLGEDEFRRYLVWFQNPAEIRPTGGFVGTLGVLTLERGAVKDLAVDSIYDIANQANRSIEDEQPDPFRRFARSDDPAWSLQNANWSPDFPSAARRFQRYYERGGGATTDGVAAITITPFVELLEVLGPIEMPEYGYTFTAENFQTTMQDDQLERSQAGDRDPKRILRDFVPKLLASIGEADEATRAKAVAILADAARSGDLQLYFTRDRHQDLLGEAKLAGRLEPATGRLALVDANIAGYKTSRDIATELERGVTIAEDGTVSETLTVIREHSGESDTRDNLNYTRLFLPPGSRVTGHDGWNAETLQGQEPVTWEPVVGGWTDVPVFGEREYSLRYDRGQLADLTAGTFSLSYRAQPGTAVNVRTVITLPEGYAWSGREGATVSGRRITLTETADTDLLYDLTFTRTD
ncbi:MAG: DUF4012 domain-containing protein, partial [Patescibacteria group bacterium]